MSFILVSGIYGLLLFDVHEFNSKAHLIGLEIHITLSDSFTGGFPDDQSIAERTLNRFHYPFRGCLQDVFVNSDVAARTGEHLDFAKLEGQNIGICDLEDNFV